MSFSEGVLSMEKYETVINPRGGAVLSHMGYIVMCCRIGSD